MFPANYASASLHTLRAEIFGASLRVKQTLQSHEASAANAAAWLVEELAHRHLSAVLVDGGCVVDNRIVVQLTHDDARLSHEGVLPGRLAAQGLEMGLLIDFDKDLLVDGITTVEREDQ
jgi:hypothetical protein